MGKEYLPLYGRDDVLKEIFRILKGQFYFIFISPYRPKFVGKKSVNQEIKKLWPKHVNQYLLSACDGILRLLAKGDKPARV